MCYHFPIMSNQKSITEPTYTLPELFNINLQPIKVELEHLRQAIEKLTKETITMSEFERLRADVDTFSTLAANLDERIDTLEHQSKVLKWVLGVVTSVGTALVIGLMSRLVD